MGVAGLDGIPRVEMWSEFILSSILYGCEQLLDGRYTDVDELAGFLARDAVRLVEGELRWYGRLQSRLCSCSLRRAQGCSRQPDGVLPRGFRLEVGDGLGREQARATQTGGSMYVGSPILRQGQHRHHRCRGRIDRDRDLMPFAIIGSR